MRALHILAVVLLVLLLIGQIRVGCRAEFNSEIGRASCRERVSA